MTTTARDAKWNAKIREQRRAQRKRRQTRLYAWAREKHNELVQVLGGRCVHCEEDGTTAPLSIDHIDAVTWDHSSVNLYWRVRRYWDEYARGVRLRVLCVPCNSSRGRPEPESEGVPF